MVQIEDGEIHATINQKDGMVSFHEDPEQYKSVEMVEHIDSSIQRCVSFYHYWRQESLQPQIFLNQS